MPLKKRAIAIIGSFLFIYTVFTVVFYYFLYCKQLQQLQLATFKEGIDATLYILNNQLTQIKRNVFIAAECNKMYHLIQNNLSNLSQIKVQLKQAIFKANADFALIIDTDKKVISTQNRNLKSQKVLNTLLKSEFIHKLFGNLTKTKENIYGYYKASDNIIVLFCASKITGSNPKKAAVGLLIMGKKLSTNIIKAIENILKLKIKITYQLPKNKKLELLTSEKRFKIIKEGNHFIGVLPIKDIFNNKPIAYLNLRKRGEIYTKGKSFTLAFIIFTTLSLIISGLIIVTFINKNIISRITKLSKIVSKTDPYGLIKKILPKEAHYKDEIFNLYKSIYRMLNTIKIKEEELLKEKETIINITKKQKKLFKIIQQLERCTSYKELLSTLTEHIPNLIDQTDVTLVLLKNESGNFEIALNEIKPIGNKTVQEVLNSVIKKQVIGNKKGITGYVLKTKKAYLCPDVGKDEHYIPSQEDIKTAMSVPIIYEEELLGAITIESTSPSPYTETELQLLYVLASYLAVKSKSIKMFEQLKKETTKLRVIHTIFSEIALEKDNTKMCEKLLYEIKNRLEYGYIIILKLNLSESKEILLMEAIFGEKIDEKIKFTVLKAINKKLLQQVINKNEILHEKKGPYWIYYIPISYQNEIYAIFSIRFDKKPAIEELNLFQIISDYTSTLWKLHEMLDKLENQAQIDPLTGLWNRRYMETRLKEEEQKVKRYGGKLSIAVLDLRDFKKINDTYGHTIGDHILKEIAQKTKESIRSTDIPIRYGGDEILIIFPQTSKEEAETVLKRLSENIKDIKVPGTIKTVEIDWGIAEYPTETKSLKDTIALADVRMYEKKFKEKYNK